MWNGRALSICWATALNPRLSFGGKVIKRFVKLD
jgi:hypothetical protein